MKKVNTVYKLLDIFDSIEFSQNMYGSYYNRINEKDEIMLLCLENLIDKLDKKEIYLKDNITFLPLKYNSKEFNRKITLREFFDLIEKEDYPDYVIYYGEKYLKSMAGETLCDYISKDYDYLMLDIFNRNFLWNLLEEEIEICINRKEN